MKIDRDVFKTVAALQLGQPGLASGTLQADRRSARRGRGVEFADYRAYAPGDDLRFVDWNIYARLDVLLVRLFHEDLNMTVHVALDATASMDAGTPKKSDHGAMIAGCLALLALKHQDHVTLGCLGGKGARVPARGHNTKAFPQFVHLLESTEAQGDDALGMALRSQMQGARPDRLIVVSDMLQPPDGIEETLRAIAVGSEHGALVHVLSDEELDPPMDEPFHVTDAETGEVLLIPGGEQAKRHYQEVLQEWLDLVQRRCRALGIDYVQVRTDESIEVIMQEVMRRGRVTASATGDVG